jgi:hypothetical protein
MEARKTRATWPDDLDTVQSELAELLIDVRDTSRQLGELVVDDAPGADVWNKLAYHTLVLGEHWLQDVEGVLTRCIEVLDRR